MIRWRRCGGVRCSRIWSGRFVGGVVLEAEQRHRSGESVPLLLLKRRAPAPRERHVDCHQALALAKHRSAAAPPARHIMLVRGQEFLKNGEEPRTATIALLGLQSSHGNRTHRRCRTARSRSRQAAARRARDRQAARIERKAVNDPLELCRLRIWRRALANAV